MNPFVNFVSRVGLYLVQEVIQQMKSLMCLDWDYGRSHRESWTLWQAESSVAVVVAVRRDGKALLAKGDLTLGVSVADRVDLGQ